MKERDARLIKKTVLFALAGMAAAQLAQEIPAMIRYIKMKRL